MFSVCVDHVVAATVRLDPHKRDADRRWVNIALDVPASATGTHVVTLETRGPEGTDFGWALFRNLAFIALVATPAAHGDEELSVAERHTGQATG
jgi:hypothetical protein